MLFLFVPLKYLLFRSIKTKLLTINPVSSFFFINENPLRKINQICYSADPFEFGKCFESYIF